MYATQFFVGAKYGMWATGTETFATAELAEREISSRFRLEKRSDLTPIFRRVVAVARQRRAA